MKIVKLNIILLLISFSSYSQSLERSVLASGGTSVSNAQGSLAFTMGEVVVSEITDGTTKLGQGFHQEKLAIVLGIPEQELVNIQLYPNPVVNTFSIDGLKEKSLITVYDMSGRLVLNQKGYLNGKIDVTNLSSATYFVKIENNEGVGLRKIQKR